MPKAFFHQGNQKWAVQYGKGLSGVGKPRMVYYESETEAIADIKRRERERRKFGQSVVTHEERTMILFLRQQLGDLSKVPAVLEHWRKTGPEAITPTLVGDAVQKFKEWQLPRVKARTQSDIRWRLDTFSESFAGRYLHELNAGDLETWIHGRGAAWSVRSFWKRLAPMFSYAVRHRWIAENPMFLLRAPEVPGESKAVYTGEQLARLLRECNRRTSETGEDVRYPDYLEPFICLTAFGWLRTSELVRQYSTEDVVCWEDIEWKRSRVHVRATVGKATRRRSGNERWVPMTDNLWYWLSFQTGKAGFIVPVLHSEFAAQMRRLHAGAGVKLLHNGFRRSAISMYLAAHPETGIGEIARRAGTSELTVKRHYLESLTPEQGREWFALPRTRPGHTPEDFLAEKPAS
jgi:integrase